MDVCVPVVCVLVCVSGVCVGVLVCGCVLVCWGVCSGCVGV